MGFCQTAVPSQKKRYTDRQSLVLPSSKHSEPVHTFMRSSWGCGGKRNVEGESGGKLKNNEVLGRIHEKTRNNKTVSNARATKM